MDFMDGWPYPAAVATLFVIVMVRANATYWLGRAAYAGAGRTRIRRVLQSPGYRRAQRLIRRWGAPVITISFLTVGFQTLVNAAAGATRMPLRRYLPAMTLGCILWAFLYATVGLATFTAWLKLYRLSPVGAIVVLALLVLALVIYVLRQLRTREPEVSSS